MTPVTKQGLRVLANMKPSAGDNASTFEFGSCSCIITPYSINVTVVCGDNTDDHFYSIDSMFMLSSYHRNHGRRAVERRNDLLVTLSDRITGFNLITV